LRARAVCALLVADGPGEAAHHSNPVPDSVARLPFVVTGPLLFGDLMICLACAAGFINECYYKQRCDLASVTSILPDERVRRSGPYKDDDKVTDIYSTGRKRAAVAYPITEGMKCEWRELKFAGGGVEPIIGCTGNLVKNRHHGPDKNTLNNIEGNVHRICPHCHNRWHTKNDFEYEAKFSTDLWLPHDGETKATVAEILASEVKWRGVKLIKAKD
jgi:hypothetical protein